MDIEAFRQTIKQQLQDFTDRQTVEYNRRCALLALPYLCGEGHMDFWPNKDRQFNLYKVFREIDAITDFILRGSNGTTNAYFNMGFFLATNAYETINYYKQQSTGKIAAMLLQTLSDIRLGIVPNQIECHGQIWKNFQDALKIEDCHYWANLYQKIFDNGFNIDIEALDRRLNVPEEIQDQDAAPVGHYLAQIEAALK